MSFATTTKPWRRPIRIKAVILSLILAMLALPTQAADDYLDALDSEVSDLEVTNAVAIDQLKAVEQEPTTFPEDLDLAAFEEVLSSHFIGSFMFYNKLNDSDKAAVYEEYQGNKDIELIRKKIIHLFSAK